MTEERKNPPDLDTLVEEEAKATGLTAEMIKDAVQRELASQAAIRILDKLRPPSTTMQDVKLEGL